MTTVTTPGTYSVFLSYSRADSDVADLLQHTLEGSTEAGSAASPESAYSVTSRT